MQGGKETNAISETQTMLDGVSSDGITSFDVFEVTMNSEVYSVQEDVNEEASNKGNERAARRRSGDQGWQHCPGVQAPSSTW